VKSRDFVYWLQGYFVYWLQGYIELAPSNGLSTEQVETIKKHLAMVFVHEIDPSFPPSQQQPLNTAHNPSGGKSSDILYRC
jgi:CRISPR/Cas system type I-B associated protein Csh2 (Cas7 group RAMP superfamily)